MAKKLGTALYKVQHNLWSRYLRNELRQPQVPAYRPAQAKVLFLKSVPLPRTHANLEAVQKLSR